MYIVFVDLINKFICKNLEFMNLLLCYVKIIVCIYFGFVELVYGYVEFV